jgi:hypothetical protein
MTCAFDLPERLRREITVTTIGHATDKKTTDITHLPIVASASISRFFGFISALKQLSNKKIEEIQCLVHGQNRNLNIHGK